MWANGGAFLSYGYIQGSNLSPEPLSKDEERICLEKMANGDEEARNKLIERNLRLVAYIAKKFNFNWNNWLD